MMTGKKKESTTRNSQTTGYRVFSFVNDASRPNCDGKYGGVGWYRIINPLEKIGADVERGTYMLGQAESALKMKKRGDIWVVKPIDSPEAITLLLTAKNFSGAKLVLDLDDDPFNVDKDHPNYKYHVTQAKAAITCLLENSDHVIVSTDTIKDIVKTFNKNVTVIPNAIDPAIWNVRRKTRKDGKIRIGWVGSASHIVDVPVVKEALEEILKKYPQVELHIAGMHGTDGQQGRERFYHGTKGYEEFPQFMADMDLDIGIAPLKDSVFNRAKSNIKWMEHAMLEIPMVLSDVKPYSDCVKNYKTGYLAKGKSQWVKYLSWLIENDEKRKEIGKAAKEEVMKNWLIDQQLPKYDKLFKKLMPKNITVYTSVTGEKDSLIEPKVTDGADFVAFTEQESEEWEVKTPYDRFKDDRRNSRIQKMMPHLYFDTEYSVYLDGNISLKVPAQKLIDEFLKDKDVAVFRHVGRDSIYDEAEACVALGKEDKDILREQCHDYAKRGILEHAGLAECGVIIRRHTPEVARMNEKWWAEYCRYSKRDQISFPVAFDLEKVNLIESSVWRHPYFELKSHKNETL